MQTNQVLKLYLHKTSLVYFLVEILKRYQIWNNTTYLYTDQT